jgi:hypothetical protein
MRQLACAVPFARSALASSSCPFQVLIMPIAMHRPPAKPPTGHGGYEDDPTGLEIDGQNETLCPVDCQESGQIVDDELNRTLINPLPKVLMRTPAWWRGSGGGLAWPGPFPSGPAAVFAAANPARPQIHSTASWGCFFICLPLCRPAGRQAALHHRCMPLWQRHGPGLSDCRGQGGAHRLGTCLHPPYAQQGTCSSARHPGMAVALPPLRQPCQRGHTNFFASSQPPGKPVCELLCACAAGCCCRAPRAALRCSLQRQKITRSRSTHQSFPGMSTPEPSPTASSKQSSGGA